MLYDKIQFESDEKILAQSRRHWFVLATELATLFTWLLVPFVLLLATIFVISKTGISLQLSNYSVYFTFIYLGWSAIVLMQVFNSLTNYYLDILTVTNHRVILINQKGFFHRNTGSFRLERLQDMHVEVNGLLATFLDFGTIHAETAGNGDKEEEFRATSLPNPRELRGIISTATDDLIRTYREKPLSTDGV